MIMITVKINGKEYKAEPGVCLGQLAAREGAVAMICGGHGKCGKCRGTVSGAVSAPTGLEERILGEELRNGVRLLCRTYAEGDCEVTTYTQTSAQIRGDGDLPPHEHAPSFSEYGVAADIGTTTVAVRLYGRDGSLLASESSLNPQRAFGGDVISRMEAALSGKADELAALIRDCLSALISRAANDAGIPPEKIDGAVIAGNTVMLYLLTLTDTELLTHAPFEAKRLFGETLTASKLGITALPPDAEVYIPPCVSAFVGADTTSAVTSSGLAGKDGVSVLTDIGTNGETVLKYGGGMLACSTAAGPAFEGAGIEMGMGGSPGAIDRVKALPDGTYSVHVIGDTEPEGVCGSGLVDALAAFIDTEAIDETGFMEDDPVTLKAPVVITQNDVRAAQLAKSAIHAGIRTLLHTAGVSCGDVETLYIAGGFGSYLDVKNAGKIGLIPSELVPRVKVLGNASLSGASLMLLSLPVRRRCEETAKKIKLTSLAANPVFAEEYMERMMF